MTTNLQRINEHFYNTERYNGPLVLTCQTCVTQRAPQAFEGNILLGGSTMAHCSKCGDMKPHWIGKPEEKRERPTVRRRAKRS